jgi:hypothetical protein
MTFFYRDSWQVQLCEADLRTLCRASRIAPRREAWDDSEIRGAKRPRGVVLFILQATNFA